jgi:hypothetical protein
MTFFKIKSFSASVLIMFVISNYTYAQLNNDAGLWNTFSIQYPIKKNYSINFDQELRLKENYSRLNLLYTNIGVSYKRKGLKIEPSYRFIQRINLDGNFSFRHRLSLDVNYKKKFGKFAISERARYQAEVKNVYSSTRAFLPEQYFRLRTMLDYNINDNYSIYYSCELRYQIDVPNSDVVFNGTWHRIRNVIGVDYKINSKNIIGVYYLVQNEFNISPPENIYITGLQYSLGL